MHELAVSQALVAQVSAIAAARHAVTVSDIHIRLGALSGVETALLRGAFPLAAAGTIAAGASLHVSDAPIRVHCGECGAESPAAANHLICGSCGSWRTQLISGDELTLVRVELQCGPAHAMEAH